MRNIKLTRNEGPVGLLRALKLYVDGTEIGSVMSGETVMLDISDGTQEIYGKMDWAKTNKFSLGFVKDGDELFANARFTLNPLRIFGIIELPIKIQTHP